MDPVSAVGIAAAVVQFADFGFRLLKNAHELYKSPSGQAPEYVHLSEISKDLSRLTDAVKAKLDENKGPVTEIFEYLHSECMSTSKELQDILSELTVQGSTKIELAANGIKVAFRRVTVADYIESLADRLSEIRRQMNVTMLYVLLDEAGKNGVELRQFARQQADMIATLDQIDSTTKKFSTDIISLIEKWPISNKNETNEMVRYVLSDRWKASKYAKQAVFDDSLDDEKKLDKVCRNLYFESISYRERSIPKRHAATFEWVFHEPRTSEDGHALWSCFPLWLRGESPDIYWITGKPGAGKSTLVKFISQDSRFEALLQEWAAGSQLLVARFFSWTSGVNKLQKSQEGLFRTLLFEAIQQRPQLVIDIFPARWFLLQSFNGNVNLPELTINELKAGFQNLLSQAGDKLKLALLIDGLDEFDESHGENHRDLIRLLRDANAQTGVKICASSRPWNIFRDEYSNNPMLQLENLTREDIKSFVQEQLQLSPGYSEFAATNPQAACKIITDIVDKSQGVFLWVSVISGLLEAALQEGTSISDLQATIDNLPKEVDHLFRYIWNRTSKRFRAEASQYFRLVRTCQEHETNMFALTLWFGEKKFPVDFDTASVTSTYLTGVIKSLERRLMSRTGGLLELVFSNDDHTKKPEEVRVDYMHRTANDWVSDNWVSITSATDTGFDPLFWFVKGEALSVVFTTKIAVGNFTRLRQCCRSIFNNASLVPEDHPDKGVFFTALDRLDHHMVSHMTISPGSSGAYYWVNFLKLPPEVDWLNIHSDLTRRFGTGTLSCTNFLELSARVPIPAYLKQRAQENPDLFSTAYYYVGILNNVIFGEFWFENPKARLDLLDFLTQEKYCLQPEWLHMIKAAAEYTKFIFSEKHMPKSSIPIYLTKVIRVLESRIPQAIPQADQNGATVGVGGGSSSRASVASNLQNKTPKPKPRNEFRISFNKMFRRNLS